MKQGAYSGATNIRRHSKKKNHRHGDRDLLTFYSCKSLIVLSRPTDSVHAQFVEYNFRVSHSRHILPNNVSFHELHFTCKAPKSQKPRVERYLRTTAMLLHLRLFLHSTSLPAATVNVAVVARASLNWRVCHIITTDCWKSKSTSKPFS